MCQGGISSSVLSVFFTDKFYKLLKSLHLIGWEQICQWKTLTKCLMKCPPEHTLSQQTKNCIAFNMGCSVAWTESQRVTKCCLWGKSTSLLWDHHKSCLEILDICQCMETSCYIIFIVLIYMYKIVHNLRLCLVSSHTLICGLGQLW